MVAASGGGVDGAEAEFAKFAVRRYWSRNPVAQQLYRKVARIHKTACGEILLQRRFGNQRPQGAPFPRNRGPECFEYFRRISGHFVNNAHARRRGVNDRHEIDVRTKVR